MGLMSNDLARLSPAAQKQVMEKMQGKKPQKKNKYRNEKTVRIMPNGEEYEFHSKKEAERYDALMLLQKAGEIRGLKLQVRYWLQEAHILTRYYEGLCGKALFLAVWAADCDKVVIENPTPSKVFEYPEPTQAIQPYQYGHEFTKKTLLWERGVKPLEPTNIVKPTATWCPSGSYSHKHGVQHKGMFTTDRAKNRAKTFPGIAKAMAEQWGGDVRGELT